MRLEFRISPDILGMQLLLKMDSGKCFLKFLYRIEGIFVNFDKSIVFVVKYFRMKKNLRLNLDRKILEMEKWIVIESFRLNSD